MSHIYIYKFVTKITSFTSIIQLKIVREYCHFVCSKKGKWNRNILTSNHKNISIVTKITSKNIKILVLWQKLHQKTSHYSCNICLKQYNSRNGLWNHKKNCNINENIVINNETENENTENENIIVDSSNNHIVELLIKENIDFKNIILDLVKSNTDLQKQMVDVCQKIQPVATTINNNNNNTTNNTTNNKTFNLQFFLNEQCKDAMNIKDFVQSIQIKMSDLERIGKEGYVEGISKLILEKLRETDIYKRPLHCSDAKRETMYIKENDVWNKDESLTNEKLIRFIKDVDNKNYDFLTAYALEFRDVFNGNSPLNTPFLFMVKNSTRDDESVKKVIKKIIKEVLIKK